MTLRWRIVTLGLLGILDHAKASPLSLGDARYFNVFSFGDVQSASDIGSRLFVGGTLLGDVTVGNHNFNESNYGYAFPFTTVLSDNNPNFKVTQNTGGNVYAPGYVENGSGNNKIQIQNGLGSVVVTGVSPINVMDSLDLLTNLSAFLATRTANGTVLSYDTNHLNDQNNHPNNPNSIYLDATDPAQTNYFNLTPAQFASIGLIKTRGKTVVVNVVGSGEIHFSGSPFSIDNFGQQPTGDSLLATKVLFNFKDASGIVLDQGWGGAILGPQAALRGSAQANGTFIVKSVNYHGEIHGAPFTGDLPSQVPEPSSMILFSTGALLIVARARALRAKRP